MNSENMTAKIVGGLFITASAAVILTYIPLGFIIDRTPDYLVKVSANENQVLIGMLLELIWALAVIGIPIMLFPILKKHDETLALGFFSFRLIEGIITLIGTIALLSLLTLSQAFVQAGTPASSHYQTLGDLLLAVRDWSFIIGPGLSFALSALILNYVLYRSKLIPLWLSGWGLIGAILCFPGYMFQFLGTDLDILFIPIALQEMAFAVWLIVKGFNPSVIPSK
ncbi:MAG: DUF4386 domain-containing protein [Candidatus Hodarchaeales archaeon]|jgi:hypothetical protein